MLLVILGAGASYDSVPDLSRYHQHMTAPSLELEYRPPLTKELLADRPLFGQVLDRFPQCTPLVNVMRKRLEEGLLLEEALRSYQEDAEEYAPHHRHLAAFRFYLQQVLWECGQRWHMSVNGMTNYLDLFYRLDRWRSPNNEQIFVVTFNYDLMLESALRASLSISFESVASYTAAEELKVFKVHGSVNWGHPTAAPRGEFIPEADQARRALIDSAEWLNLSDEFVLRNPNEHPGDRGRGTILYPAIAIPVDRKSEFECPPEHLDTLRAALSQAYTILVVGWRATEQHFLSVLDEGVVGKAPRIEIIGASLEGVQETKSNLETGANFHEPHMTGYSDGLSNYLRTKQLEAFLTA